MSNKFQHYEMRTHQNKKICRRDRIFIWGISAGGYDSLWEPQRIILRINSEYPALLPGKCSTFSFNDNQAEILQFESTHMNDIINKPWYEILKLPVLGTTKVDLAWAETALEIQAMMGAPPVVSFRSTMTIKADRKEIIDLVTKFGRVLHQHEFSSDSSKDSRDGIDSITTVWPTGMIVVEGLATSENGALTEIDIGVTTSDLHVRDEIKQFVDSRKHKIEPKKDSVYVIVQSDGGLVFESIGLGGVPLLRENYSAEVIRGIDKIVADLASPTPSGRLAILNGSPGTGKTYSTRGIIHESKAIFVIVPPAIVSELGSPSVVPSLIDLRQRVSKETPIVFIIEDADSCLVDRAEGDMNAISSVLNMCDGILGSLLDIRILATTNASKISLDKALLRPGRLSGQIEIGALSFDESTKVAKRLMGDDYELPEQRKYCLAEIYNIKNEGSSKALNSVPEPVKLGF